MTPKTQPAAPQAAPAGTAPPASVPAPTVPAAPLAPVPAAAATSAAVPEPQVAPVGESAVAASGQLATTAATATPAAAVPSPTDSDRLEAPTGRRAAGQSPYATRTGGASLFGANSGAPAGNGGPIRVLTTPVAAASTVRPLAAASSADSSDDSGKPASTSLASASTAPASSIQSANAQSAAAASAASALGAAPRPQVAADDSIVSTRASVDLAQSSDRLMGQVVQTIHTYQTSAGPSLEARVSDPTLGDVRLVVTGRAGEIVQAQLIVKDSVTADALTAAAARAHASGDALAGVNVTVRSETGGGWTSGGRNGNSESAAWAAGGWGGGTGSGSANGQGSHGTDAGSQAGSGSGSTSDGSRGSNRPHTSPFDDSPANSGRAKPRLPLRGGSSLDIRA